MLDTDIRLLSAAKLSKLAKFYGLRQRGVRGLWVVRKEATDSRTKQLRILKRSTKTTDLRLALYRASTWVDEFLGRVHLGLPTFSAANGFASLEAVEAHYLVAATCSPQTRRKNLTEFHVMLGEIAPGDTPAQIITEALDGRLVRQWQLLRKAEAEKLLPHDVEGCERLKRGANALYRQARSLFSRAMLRAYEDAGLRLPIGVREFAQQGFIPAAKPPPSEQLSPEVVAKMMRLMPRLREVRPGVWACVLLMFRGGLRNSEACKARWSWILPAIGGGYALQLRTHGDYKPKAGDHVVMLAPQIVDMLQTVRRPDDDHLVPASTDYERYTACGRAAGKFLRACGLKAIKGKLAYRLRGHAITEVMLATGSLEAAREFAGHSSSRTTEIYRGAAMPYAPLALPSA